LRVDLVCDLAWRTGLVHLLGKGVLHRAYPNDPRREWEVSQWCTSELSYGADEYRASLIECNELDKARASLLAQDLLPSRNVVVPGYNTITSLRRVHEALTLAGLKVTNSTGGPT